MESLIRYVEEGGHLESHDDIPEMIRQQLYAEQQERSQRQYKAAPGGTGDFPPITINNVLPSAIRASSSTQPEATTGIVAAMRTSLPRDLELPGFRDVALNEYSQWHQSRVHDTNLKDDFEKVRKIALEHALDLDLIHEENDPDFFEKQGVKKGTAKRFVRDIEGWAKRYKGEGSDSISVTS